MHIPVPFVELIERHSSFVLTGHEHPDGDCLGAEVAMYHLLRALGKEVAVVNPDPAGRAFDFLAVSTPFGDFRTESSVPEAEVVCLLDCALFGRTGAMAPALRAAVERGAVPAVVDHHVGSENGDGQVAFVDATAPATGALVHALFARFGVALEPAAATGVFVSLVSDTGWFRYSNTDAGVLALAASLVESGVDPSYVYDQLNRRNHPDSVAVMGQALAGCELMLDGRLGALCLDKAMMDRISRASFDTDLLMEPMRSVEGIEVVALLKERFDGMSKLSLRASHDIDVQEIAAHFGGGGHRKAAGATVALPMARVLEQVRDLVHDALARRDRGEGAAP